MKPLLILFVMMATMAVQAQVKFEAKVSKKKLGVNERLRVDFEMNQDGDNFSPPSFEGFRVVGGPNQSISNSWINGKRSFSKTYSYFLAPQSKGSFTIGQATVEIDGQVYKSPPISVTVTTAVDIPKDGNNANYLASENVHLIAEVSNSNPYLNEAITVTYKLYVSYDVNVSSGWREIDSPKYADFWSQTLDNKGNLKIYEGKYNGEDYRYVILRTTVLYPQKTGKLNIEPLTLDIPIDVRSNKRDIFGRFLMTRVNRTISAGSRDIDVKPLPMEGKPANFTGAVGQFDFNVTATPTQLDANESLELKVSVAGEGNLKLFDVPSVTLPSSLEVYEPTREENIKTPPKGMTGSIVENYTIVPQFKGNYPIRPISFSYFDPKTETYHTLSSEEIILRVENGPVTASNEQQQQNNKQVVSLENDQFKYIMLDAQLEPIAKEDFFQSKLFWSLLATPFVVIPLFIFFGIQRRKRLDDTEGLKLRRANALAKKYLGEAKRNINDKDTFYESLERALHNYLKAKLGMETSEMSKERISDALSAKRIDPETTTRFITLLKNCELARYAGANPGTIQKDYDMAVNSLSEIDKQFNRA